MRRFRILQVLPLLVLAMAGCDHAERLDFVIEDGGTPVGTLTMWLQPTSADSSTQVIEVESEVSLSALGKTMDLQRTERLEIDPRTGLARSIVRHTRLGDLELTGTVEVDGDSLRMVSLKGDRVRVPLADDLFLEDGLHFGFLLDGLASAAPADRWRYRGVDLDGGRLVDVTARRGPADSLTLDTGPVAATVVDLQYPALDVVRRIWIDPADGRLLQAVGGDGVGIRRGVVAPVSVEAPGSEPIDGD